jgi:hypothetical protein
LDIAEVRDCGGDDAAGQVEARRRARLRHREVEPEEIPFQRGVPTHHMAQSLMGQSILRGRPSVGVADMVMEHGKVVKLA